jgi:Na+-transporting NADH:ubiquinone oxidoreductase subunit NqrB
VLGRLLSPLERAAFRPDTLRPDLVMGIALVPTVVAGLALFRLAAAEMLGVAVAVGAVAHLVAHLSRQRLEVSPVIPAVIGVGLLGPGAPLAAAGVVAVAAAAVEVARAHLLPAAGVHAGLLAYSALFLATGGIASQYLSPGTSRPLAEPVALWLAYFGGTSTPVDPVRLYVGNVPGPVFATSLLAVAVGAAWLWYSRRLSLAVLAGFAVGTAAIAVLMRWNPGFHLDSGPAWFAVVFVLADRRLLRASALSRPFLGLAAGMVAMGVRAAGHGVEYVFLTVCGLQLVVAAVGALAWAGANRARIGTAIARELRRLREVRRGTARRDTA